MTGIRQHAAWVSVALLLVCTSGCSSSKGAVAGRLHLVGGAPPGSDRPAAGKVYAFTSASLTGAPIATVKTGSDGRFKLRLSPGRYYLAATSPSFTLDPPPATPPCRGNRPAVVNEGGTTRVDVTCSMK
jgi:hypothetical protein